MNHIDRSLQRLLKMAARAPAVEVDPLPPYLEARLLGQWRSLRSEDWSDLLPLFFRRAVVCASVVMLTTLCWGALEARRAVPGSTALLNLNDTVQVLPWAK